MKRRITAVLAFLLVLAMLFGCTKAQTENTTEAATTTVTTTAATTQTTAASTTSTTAKTTATTTSTTATTAATTTTTTKKAKPSTTAKKHKEKKTHPAKTTAKPVTATTKSQKVDRSKVTVTIKCSEVLGNMDKLADGHEKYVPKSGYIIKNYTLKYRKGDTVYTVLQRTCRENDVKMWAKRTGYGMYVVGINELDEKDCGGTSGWTYYVNGDFPMVSVDNYDLRGGESIEFKYVV